MDDELRLVLEAVVRFCMLKSYGVRELLDTSRQVFVDLAVEELKKRGEKVTVSRVSVMTGLQRPIVKDCFAGRKPADPTRFTLRVIGQWRYDKRFLGKSGKPRVLTYDADNGEFQKLVHSVSSDLHPQTILFDLQRLNLVEMTSQGVKLLSRGYATRKDAQKGYKMLARDTRDLMLAIQDNLTWSGEQLPNYHGTTEFDNISEEDLPKIRDWLFKNFAKLHLKTEKELAKYDVDLNRGNKGKGGKRVMVGLFSRTT